MAFQFNWPKFTKEDHLYYQKELYDLIFQNMIPLPILCDNIWITSLSFGESPPQLRILSIKRKSKYELTTSIKFSYKGDAHIQIQTCLNLSSLGKQRTTRTSSRINSHFGVLSQKDKLELPIVIKVSELWVDGVITISIDPNTGIKIHFLNNPLKNITIDTNFNYSKAIHTIIQNSIPFVLNKLFKDDQYEIEIPLNVDDPEFQKVLQQAFPSTSTTDETKVNK
ncbi:distribution and morphology protein [Anaeramoeba flamelloides]|uniref:Distribution and morphology protein n=1 Tax=Anaeramoeba flamelloides TaxID=1746091 RepID=A0AAV8A1V2_9EUKA|nr:distribution and morphology protein [Anaeramoeba flamelloides]KAJ6247908.1 distribution and morphology protein [Anaeramoeba flamelloides]